MEYVILALVVIAAVVGVALALRHVVVFEYERGLKYASGHFSKVLEPGSYWYVPLTTTIWKLDVRPRVVTVAGQEVLTADGVTVKVSLAAEFEIVDPDRAVNGTQSYQDSLYTELQLILRELIGGVDIDTLLATRAAASDSLFEQARGKAESLGLRLRSVGIKDIMFPGNLKDMFAQVVAARKEGLAVLEKARGEQAALRNLANVAKLMEANPTLFQLRLLQTLGESSGNTVFLDATSQPVATAEQPVAAPEPAPAPTPAKKRPAKSRVATKPAAKKKAATRRR